MREEQMGKHAGFTLVEMLVVIAIIVVLAAIIFPTLNRARETARQSKCMSHLIEIYQAIKMYRDDHKSYPLPPHHDNDFWRGGVSALFPDYITSPQSLLCPNEVRLTRSDSQAPAQGGVLASSYNGLHAKGEPLQLEAVFYNYYGYSRANLDPNTGTPVVQEGWLPTMMSFQEWDLLDGQQDGRGPKSKQFPCLVNRNAPANTIITLCPWHRQHFGSDPSKERFLVLRLDGSVDKLKWVDYDWIRQPGL